MPYLKLRIEMDRTLAFANGVPKVVLARTLNLTAARICQGLTAGRILDPLGSYCGTFEIVKRKGEK